MTFFAIAKTFKEVISGPSRSQRYLERPTGGAFELAVVGLLFASYFVVYFSPALLEHRLLAPGDGVLYYVPALLSRGALWNHDLYAGYPSFADSQALVLSPLRLAVGNYNVAVIAVYVIASTSAYCLVRYLTGLRAAGALAGLVYGSGGAMIAHLGHLTIIYSAAWLPLILWATARSRESDLPGIAIGAIAIAASIMGGHPQIFTYGLATASLYALYYIASDTSPGARVRLALRYGVMIGCGVALACIQLIPLAELGAWSLRDQLSFWDFTTYALAPKDLLLFFFPLLFGSQSRFEVPYFGSWNLTELATYVGAATLLLALTACTARRRERQVWFWVAIVVVGLLYALGDTTPLAELAFRVPGLNQFRAPARTAFETSLALSVVAGFGLRAIIEGRVTGGRVRRLKFRALLLFGIPTVVLAALYPVLVSAAAAKGVALPTRWRNSAIVGGLAAMAVSTGVVFWIVRRPSALAVTALLVVVTVDLGSFGWYYEWRDGESREAILQDPSWQHFAGEVRGSHSRVLFLDGITSGPIPAIPNLNVLYGLPSAGAYGPLILRRYAEVVDIDSTGAIRSLTGLRRRLQLVAADWVVGGRENLQRSVHLGGDCSARPGVDGLTVPVTGPVRATQLEIVSHMQCSVPVTQDTPVLAIRAESTNGQSETAALRAGIDTAEWAIDRHDVAGVVSHHRPSDSETFPVGDFTGRWYRATVQLNKNGSPMDVSSLNLRWLLPPGPGFAVRSIRLVDATTGKDHRIGSEDLMWGIELKQAEEKELPGAKWVRRVAGLNQAAWLVGDVQALSDDQALEAIRSGRLPGGRLLDPYSTAIVPADDEERVSDNSGSALGSIKIEEWGEGRLRIQVDAIRRAFLVVAESFYPGWEVTVDGQRASVVRTNVAFQGVFVPAGKHTVTFSFFPRSLILGFGLALVGLVVLLAYLAFSYHGTRRVQEAGMRTQHPSGA